MKRCIRCKLEKNEYEFNKWYKKSGTSGYRSNCRQCSHIINKEFREKNKDELKVKRRKRTGGQPRRYCTDPIKKKRNEQMYESIRKYPEKQAARRFLNSYIRLGKIVKPNVCEKCLNPGKIEGHHEDYTKPLKVKWLCKRCHTDIHWKS